MGLQEFKLFLRLRSLLNPVIIFTVITYYWGLQLFTEPQVLIGDGGGPGGEE